jgi:hypothetical protein
MEPNELCGEARKRDGVALHCPGETAGRSEWTFDQIALWKCNLSYVLKNVAALSFLLGGLVDTDRIRDGNSLGS